jgi:hypothetical protein
MNPDLSACESEKSDATTMRTQHEDTSSNHDSSLARLKPLEILIFLLRKRVAHGRVWA